MLMQGEFEMSAIRVVRVAGTETVSVIDEATGLVEIVEVSAVDETAVDTIIEDEPEASSRRFYVPRS
jgi:hypothetical protein